MAEQRRPGANPPGFEPPEFQTDTSSTLPREGVTPAAGNVLSSPPRPRAPAGAAPGGPARPPAQGAPERRPAGPSPFLERRPASPEQRRTAPSPTEQHPPGPADRRSGPPVPAMDQPSVIVEPQRRTAAPGPGIDMASERRPAGSTQPRRAAAPAAEEGGGAGWRFWPAQPRSLEDTGLTASMVEELILKAIFYAGEMRGLDIANRLKLPTSIVEDVIEGLRRQKYIDIRGGGGSGVGKSTMIYQLTTFATDVLRQILDRNRYNGPAPIRLQDWIDVVRKQTVRGNRITRQRMEDKFGDLIIRDYIFDGIGPAMNSGRAIFFYGPPGNGKTAICQGMVNCFDGEIFIPHAILIDDFVVRIFDSNLHKPIEEDSGSPPYDRRWVRCRRPLVVVGGELTLRDARPRLLARGQVLRGSLPDEGHQRDAPHRRLRPAEGLPQGPAQPVDRPAGE